MPLPRLTIDAVLEMAHATALKHANASPVERAASPEMRQAISQVWELVKGRLPAAQCEALDGLIRKITADGAARGPR